jgi:enterochelin esterase family protein
MSRLPNSAFLICLMAGFDPAIAQGPAQQPAAQVRAGREARPPAPTRDPKTPGYVKAKELAPPGLGAGRTHYLG